MFHCPLSVFCPVLSSEETPALTDHRSVEMVSGGP